ncbi:hypothetical protein PsYK624_133230 [Phanerochaete sordida]|uniref:Uncharacterized protein n=1 Tax=Phanerochaete sordida TaxID=48140 RepID=A0A9P3GKT3_9APHY|nr:hypothetical protein PsYK624_133230 [Phanerochaete sordida]
MWRVTDRVRTGTQSDDGTLNPCNHYQIKRGDFVDVVGTVDIVVPVNSKELSVRFAMKQVIQLKARARSFEVSVLFSSSSV